MTKLRAIVISEERNVVLFPRRSGRKAGRAPIAFTNVWLTASRERQIVLLSTRPFMRWTS